MRVVENDSVGLGRGGSSESDNFAGVIGIPPRHGVSIGLEQRRAPAELCSSKTAVAPSCVVVPAWRVPG